MKLIKLIHALKQTNPDQYVPIGFSNPHSYRGYYDQLAFEPVRYTTVGVMLGYAESALGATFEGYKGGDFKMGPDTECWIAEWGCLGETLGEILLLYMLDKVYWDWEEEIFE